MTWRFTADIQYISRVDVVKIKKHFHIEFKPRRYAKVSCITEREANCLALVRIEVEKLAARILITENERLNSDSLVEYVERSLFHMRNGDMADAFMNDSAFHLEIARQCDNPTLYDVLERLDSKNHLIRIRCIHAPDIYSQQLREHMGIIDCLKNRNEEGILRLLAVHIKPRLCESPECA